MVPQLLFKRVMITWILANTLLSQASPQGAQDARQQAQYYAERALTRDQSGDFNGAREDAVRSLQYAETPLAYVVYSMASYYLNEYDAALRAVNHAAEIDPAFPLVHSLKCQIYAVKRMLDDAQRNCNLAVDENPKDYIAYLARAEVNDKQGNTTRAIADASRVIELKSPPQHLFRAYLVRAFSYVKLGRYELAEQEFTSAISSQPRDTIAWETRARVRGLLHNWKGAIEDYRQIITLDPGRREEVDTWINDVTQKEREETGRK